MIARIPIIALVVLLTAPVAAAQEIHEPLAAHVEDHATSVTDDPVAYASDHASEQAVADEAEWDVAYACFAVHWAHDDVGTPEPDLEQCDDYEEVLGIAPEPEEPVSDVENLTDDPVAEVEEIADESLALVDDVFDDPISAPEAVIGFLLWLVDKIVDAIGGLASGVGRVLDAVGDTVTAALAANAHIGAAAVDVSNQGIDLVGDASHAIGSGVGHAGDGVAATFRHVSDAASAAVTGVGDAVAQAAHAVGSFVADLFHSDAAKPRGRVDDLGDPVGDASDGALDLVDQLGHVVDDAV